MSLASEVNNPAIANLVESLEWISYEEITNIKPTPTDAIYYASRKQPNEVKETMTMLLLLGSSEECTPTLVSEFARIYSLPTHKHMNDINFRRYSTSLTSRNKLVIGFTKHDDKYYMIADRKFYGCYSRYGFCIACRILRCSPVWCICGHKQLSDGWTSNNKQLDEFIKKSQLQTNSANEAYLEWIPFDCIRNESHGVYLDGLPTYEDVKLIPLEITDETHDYNYAEVNYLLLLMRHVY